MLISGPFTLFAPTDLAMRSFDNAELAHIMADPALLHSFIGFHAGFGSVLSSDITNDKELTTLAGYRMRLNVYTVERKMVSVNQLKLRTHISPGRKHS